LDFEYSGRCERVRDHLNFDGLFRPQAQNGIPER
jgi:hypothetical protein